MRGSLIVRLLLPLALLIGLPATALAQQFRFTPPAPPPAGPAPLPALALITSPEAGQRVSGAVAIAGAADWPNAPVPWSFASYTLDWGSGDNPSSYTTFEFQQVPNSGGQLGVWNTAGLPDGQYIVRLSVANRTGNYAQVVLPLVVDNSGTYAGSLFPVSSPKPQPAGSEASATILNSSSYVDPTSNQLHIVGEVQNTGNADLQFVQVTATFKDASGNALQSSMGFTLLPTLVPGQKSSFDIFTLPPAGMSSTASLTVSFDTTMTAPASGLAVSNDQLQFDSQGRLHFTGIVTNTSRAASTPFHVAYAIYDDHGITIRAGSFNTVTDLNGTALQLPPGTSGNFDYIVPSPPQTFGSYSLAIQ